MLFPSQGSTFVVFCNNAAYFWRLIVRSIIFCGFDGASFRRPSIVDVHRRWSVVWWVTTYYDTIMNERPLLIIISVQSDESWSRGWTGEWRRWQMMTEADSFEGLLLLCANIFFKQEIYNAQLYSMKVYILVSLPVCISLNTDCCIINMEWVGME